MLEKLRIEFTKSRAYRTTDNALVEGKNGAVIRKHIGYGAITAPHAEVFQKFYHSEVEPLSELSPTRVVSRRSASCRRANASADTGWRIIALRTKSWSRCRSEISA